LHYSFECDKFGSICVTDRFVTFLFDRGMFFFSSLLFFPPSAAFPRRSCRSTNRGAFANKGQSGGPLLCPE
jgi:hypothetical protein